MSSDDLDLPPSRVWLRPIRADDLSWSVETVTGRELVGPHNWRDSRPEPTIDTATEGSTLDVSGDAGAARRLLVDIGPLYSMRHQLAVDPGGSSDKVGGRR